MEKTRQNYLAWMRDAHAMEEQALQTMQGQLARLEHYPLLRDRIEAHITETKEQLSALSALLARQGSESSLVKDTMGRLTALGQAMAGMFAADEVMKGMIASYTFEQMEIACYRVLITAAEQIGDHEAIEVFTRCLEQEEAMAGWLSGHAADITRQFLSRSELDLPAQR